MKPFWICAALALAGCADQPIASFDVPRYADTGAQAQTDLYFRPGTSELANGEQARLRAFLSAQVLRTTDDVVVDIPSSGVATVDARRVQVTRGAVGPVPARVRLVGTPGFVYTNPRPDAAFVQVLRHDQVTVDCVNSGRDAFETQMLTPFPAIGCVNAINRAEMAAEVRDLTAPRVLGATDAVTGVAAVRRYQTGQTKPAPFGLGD
ncbi:MAG: CpaD family pilus assembly lipoprotein [Amaricoccus sp.]|uniref:CpaD family pilus assembly lipoprotein n=1 Tax=Amaricoccus sp. TaxID=1872485 RepID=UPI00331580CD